MTALRSFLWLLFYALVLVLLMLAGLGALGYFGAQAGWIRP